jgi:hypothetical protein
VQTRSAKRARTAVEAYTEAAAADLVEEAAVLVVEGDVGSEEVRRR